ncbi:MAG: phenylalanine--tRNA ligase subunit beta [Alphaproteobacteria bacterium]|nr:phenylalanine--tRNA ligase subunit beta [Alphaproteobacteria bacterium]
MKFTLSWLKQHLDTDASVRVIGETLTMIGLEVESIDDFQALRGFVVAHVVEAVQHPDADRLRVCTVDAGGEILKVVCGAPNARTGMKAVLARPGLTIPATGDVLKKGAIRGVESQGMLCSARELGLGQDHDGIIELAADTPVGEPIPEVMGLDPVFDISITPNRADCLGVRGVARDLAAAGLGTLKPMPVEPAPGGYDSPVSVVLERPDACPLFVGRHIRGVVNRESPDWLKARLASIGLRPISALVDITNLLSIDLARPLHVFDADRLTGGIRVRMAQEGETLAALNDRTYALSGEMIVIADEAGPQALGGVIGGTPTGCTGTTVNVFLESALFDPLRIAATGRLLGIDSDARYRFERGVDPASARTGAEIATRLILELCGGEASRLVVAGAEPDWRRSIPLRPARVGQLGGVDVPVGTMARILSNLGCEVTDGDGALSVSPPSWRGDLNAEHDLVEEVIRIHGFDKVPAVPLPRGPMPPVALTLAQRRRNWARRVLAARGMMETVTWSFMPSAQARLFDGGGADLLLANPISADLDAMRPSILPNLIAAAGRNAAHDMPDCALFEIGPQFHGGAPGEQKLVAAGLRAGVTGPRHWDLKPRPVDAFDAKADAMAALSAAGVAVDRLQVAADAPRWYHPGRSGALRLGPTVLAWFGEIHPKVARDMDVRGPLAGFEVFLEAVPEPKSVSASKARPLLRVPSFHPVTRDFAFIADVRVDAEAVVKAARGADRKLIADVRVFDVFEGANVGEGRKSLAVTVTLQPTERALTDAEIEAIAARVMDAVGKATGALLRG